MKPHEPMHTKRTEFVTRYTSPCGLIQGRVSFCRGSWAGKWAVGVYLRTDPSQTRWVPVQRKLDGPFQERCEAELEAHRRVATRLSKS